MSYLFKCPRCKRMHSVAYKEDLKDFECPADTFVVANKPKAQNQMQRFSDLCNTDGTIKKQWWTQRLNTLRDVHLEAPIVNPVPLAENNRFTGLKRGAYKY